MSDVNATAAQQAAGISGDGQRPLKVGYLQQRDSTDPGKPRHSRMYTELRGSLLSCYADMEAAADAERRPRFSHELGGCVVLRALPDTVEESVAKCRLRRRNGAPLALELRLHGQKAPTVLVADAGGDVRSWLRHMKEATWWTDAPAYVPPGCEDQGAASAAEVVRVLLDPLCHGASPGTRTLLARKAPRALLLKGSTATLTVGDVKQFVTSRTGLPAFMQRLHFEGSELCSDARTLAACGVDDRTVVEMRLKQRASAGRIFANKEIKGEARWEPSRVTERGLCHDTIYTEIGPREDPERQRKAVRGMRLEGHHVHG